MRKVGSERQKHSVTDSLGARQLRKLILLFS